jgi:hypothetical protein
MQRQQLKEIFEYISPNYKITLSSGINTAGTYTFQCVEKRRSANLSTHTRAQVAAL